jgi:hypothetical protein
VTCSRTKCLFVGVKKGTGRIWHISAIDVLFASKKGKWDLGLK